MPQKSSFVSLLMLYQADHAKTAASITHTATTSVERYQVAEMCAVPTNFLFLCQCWSTKIDWSLFKGTTKISFPPPSLLLVTPEWRCNKKTLCAGTSVQASCIEAFFSPLFCKRCSVRGKSPATSREEIFGTQGLGFPVSDWIHYQKICILFLSQVFFAQQAVWSCSQLLPHAGWNQPILFFLPSEPRLCCAIAWPSAMSAVLDCSILGLLLVPSVANSKATFDLEWTIAALYKRSSVCIFAFRWQASALSFKNPFSILSITWSSTVSPRLFSDSRSSGFTLAIASANSLFWILGLSKSCERMYFPCNFWGFRGTVSKNKKSQGVPVTQKRKPNMLVSD